MSLDLADVLAEATNQAAVLRLHGQPAQAVTLERFRDAVAASMVDYLDWINEDDAVLKSGRSIAWLRCRFPEWATANLARWDGAGRRARRVYRRVIVPQRANLEAAYRQGRESA